MIRPDPSLHGNHDACPACAMRREVADNAPMERALIPCNVCRGTGHIPLSSVEIKRRTCVEAMRLYWPEFDRRIAG